MEAKKFKKRGSYLTTADNGGMLSTDQREMYFMSVIDILTEYTTIKRLEHGWKSCLISRDVSCVPPKQYANRFMAYMESIIE